MNVELIPPAGVTPVLFIEVAATRSELADRTVLLYGHMDKQPEMEPWSEGLGPWTPVLHGDRLYGRGGADDGYSVFAALIAIASIHEAGGDHARLVLLIEASEESSSVHLATDLETLMPRIGAADLVITLDSFCESYDRRGPPRPRGACAAASWTRHARGSRGGGRDERVDTAGDLAGRCEVDADLDGEHVQHRGQQVGVGARADRHVLADAACGLGAARIDDDHAAAAVDHRRQDARRRRRPGAPTSGSPAGWSPRQTKRSRCSRSGTGCTRERPYISVETWNLVLTSIECEAKTLGEPSASTYAVDMSVPCREKNVGLPW